MGSMWGPCNARERNLQRMSAGEQTCVPCYSNASGRGCFHAQELAFGTVWGVLWFVGMLLIWETLWFFIDVQTVAAGWVHGWALGAFHENTYLGGHFTAFSAELAEYYDFYVTNSKPWWWISRATALLGCVLVNTNFELPRLMIAMHLFRRNGWLVVKYTGLYHKLRMWL